MSNIEIIMTILMACGFAYTITKLSNIQEGIGLLISMRLSELVEMKEENGVVLIKITEEDED